MSPSAPVPKSNQPRQSCGWYSFEYGRSGAAPSQRSQSSVLGTGGVSRGRSKSCFHHSPRPVRPRVDLADRADRPGLQPFAGEPEPFAGVAVVAHLRHQAGLAGHPRHHPRLLDRVRHRLLDVNMLAGPQRGQRDRRVHVVGRRDHHRVHALQLVEQDPVIDEPLGPGVGVERLARLDRVDVAEGDNVLAGQLLEHVAPAPADPDPRDVQLFARRNEPPPQDMPRHDLEPQSRSRDGPQETTTVHAPSPLAVVNPAEQPGEVQLRPSIKRPAPRGKRPLRGPPVEPVRAVAGQNRGDGAETRLTMAESFDSKEWKRTRNPSSYRRELAPHVVPSTRNCPP